MALHELKLLLALLTFIAGAAGGAMPLLWEHWQAAPQLAAAGSRRLVGAGNAFAAGLFLSIGLLHFLPDSAAAYSEMGITYPAASVVAVGSFLLLLLLEHVLLPEAAHDAAHAHSGEGHPSHQAHSAEGHAHPPHTAGTSPYVLLLALSVHSVLAGTVLGVDVDSRGVLLTFLAIAVHKGAAGLALGLALAGAGIPMARRLRLTGLFALMTPLGIVLGLVAGQAMRGDGRLLFDASAAALAAGAFLYIGAFDLVQDEFLRAGRRWTKWVCAVVGAFLAALLAAWV